jgi:hypothetical protein
MHLKGLHNWVRREGSQSVGVGSFGCGEKRLLGELDREF